MTSLFANRYLLAAIGALMLLTHGLAYLQGRSDGGAAVQDKYARATERALQTMRRSERIIDGLNGALARARTSQDIENRSIHDAATPLLPRPIYAIACVDADGVGLLDHAHANANRAIDSDQPADITAGSAGFSAQK